MLIYGCHPITLVFKANSKRFQVQAICVNSVLGKDDAVPGIDTRKGHDGPCACFLNKVLLGYSWVLSFMRCLW